MMMMGKRGGRPATAGTGSNPMRRTTSMTEFAPPVDVLVADVVAEEEEEADEATELEVNGGAEVEEDDAAVDEASYGWFGVGAAGAGVRADWLAAYRARAAPALAGLRRNSADFSAVETAAFLRACGLCHRRLGPGRDTFMYKGDTAFCSLECRQQHITHEEWKEKRALAIATAAAPQPPSMSDPVAPATAAGSDNPAGRTLAAA